MSFVNCLNELRERNSLQAAAALDDATSRLADGFAIGTLYGYQAGYWPAAPRDDYTLATSDSIQQAREMGLGFVGAHSFHGD